LRVFSAKDCGIYCELGKGLVIGARSALLSDDLSGHNVRNSVNNSSRKPIDHQSGNDAATNCNDEETLVIDDRASLTPSQIVEQKFLDMLRTSPLLVSQVQRRLKPGPR
jgi:hypothetical protein